MSQPLSGWWGVIPPSEIHLVYPKCLCDHCRRERGELPIESEWIPAMRPEDV